MIRKCLRLRYLAILPVCLVLLGIGCGLVKAAGSWHGTWADSPDYGYQNWYNYSTWVKWVPVFMWYDVSELHTHSNRRIELEWYDPANNNHCDRLEPYSLVESGGDWIDSWSTSNECGGWGSEDERLTFTIKESNVASYTYYGASAYANKIYTAGYGGETNVSWTCWGCGDDWLGKQSYDASYNDTGSDP